MQLLHETEVRPAVLGDLGDEEVCGIPAPGGGMECFKLAVVCCSISSTLIFSSCIIFVPSYSVMVFSSSAILVFAELSSKLRYCIFAASGDKDCLLLFFFLGSYPPAEVVVKLNDGLEEFETAVNDGLAMVDVGKAWDIITGV